MFHINKCFRKAKFIKNIHCELRSDLKKHEYLPILMEVEIIAYSVKCQFNKIFVLYLIIDQPLVYAISIT